MATGGWWRKGEIESELPTELRRDMRHVISNMTRDRLLAKRRIYPSGGPSERMEYSVTPDCLVPYGLTAGEIETVFKRRQPTETVEAISWASYLTGDVRAPDWSGPSSVLLKLSERGAA